MRSLISYPIKKWKYAAPFDEKGKENEIPLTPEISQKNSNVNSAFLQSVFIRKPGLTIPFCF
jgi:hypothetical protein